MSDFGDRHGLGSFAESALGRRAVDLLAHHELLRLVDGVGRESCRGFAKSASDARVAFVVLGAMGLASPTLEKLGIELFTMKASMLITNVPGPAGTVQVGGQDVKSMVVWAPTSGSIGLGFSLLTYAGELRLGVSADKNLVADPHALVACFEQEIEAMREEAGL